MNFPKENIIDNWLENNSNPEINKQVEKEIKIMEAAKQNNLKWYLGLTIIGLILIGIFFGCPREKVPATVEKHESNVNDSFVEIGRLESLNNSKNDEILALQNQLHKISVDFQNYKKTPLYKDRIKEIIRTVPIDTLASNTIELEVCREKSKVKDGLIKSLIDKSKFLSLQKVEFKKIDYNQNQIIDILKPKTKETFLKMNAGGGIGINRELRQGILSANVSFEGKKGNISAINYLKIKDQEYLMFSYSLEIFDWKK